MRMDVFPGGKSGKPAVTRYRVIEKLGYISLIECTLETGRTHQIRVHLEHIGHPLFNDERYGGDRILRGTTFTRYRQFVMNCFKILPRHALHAKSLGFIHPVSGKVLHFEAPIPADMQDLLEKWRKYTGGRSGDDE
jgi:23S rRNA pseudouridine1911/1915/1917 synthase